MTRLLACIVGISKREDMAYSLKYLRRLCLAATLAATSGGFSLAVEKSDFLLKTASDLASLCGAPSDAAAIHMCEGYLVGVNQMHEAVYAALGARVYCLPEDGSVTRDSAAKDYAAWASKLPAASSMSAREGVLEWARQTYPCK